MVSNEGKGLTIFFQKGKGLLCLKRGRVFSCLSGRGRGEYQTLLTKGETILREN